MSTLAGSAISQGPYVGRIDRWSEWRPTSQEPLWLLLSGATDPPKEIGISKRRARDVKGERNGEFLAGITHDLIHMEDVVGAKWHNTVKDRYLSKDAALQSMNRLFEQCKVRGAHPMLYYTGHGEIGTGNWCFEDGTISIQEIFDNMPEGCYYPMIFSDACFSGNWANFCLNKGIAGFNCLAACPEYSTATDTKGVYIERIIISVLHCNVYSYSSINNLSGSIITETIGGIQMLYRQFNNSGVSLTIETEKQRSKRKNTLQK